MEYVRKEFETKKGVGQGCTLSRLMFNACIQEAEDTIKIGPS